MTTGGNWTIEGLFEARPEASRLFVSVRSFIESMGPVTMRVTKMQVSFGTGAKFAWVWPPVIRSRRRPEDCLILTFGLRRRVEDHRIAEAVESRPGRWTHHVVLEREEDLDEVVREWLREAYAVSESVRPPPHAGPIQSVG